MRVILTLLLAIPWLVFPAASAAPGVCAGVFVRRSLERGSAGRRDLLLGALAVAIGIGTALPYLTTRGQDTSIFKIWLVSTPPAAAILTAWSRERWYCWPFALVMGVEVVVCTRIAVDLARDSTDHNLLPFELLMAAVGAGLPALLAAFVVRVGLRPPPRPGTQARAD